MDRELSCCACACACGVMKATTADDCSIVATRAATMGREEEAIISLWLELEVGCYLW